MLSYAAKCPNDNKKRFTGPKAVCQKSHLQEFKNPFVINKFTSYAGANGSDTLHVTIKLNVEIP